MAFRLEDFKKTIRKGQGDAPASLYPHQMRDKKTLGRLDIAIRLFDGLVGRRRSEMDAGALVDFFGDPRLARGVVACLGQWYQYHTPSFSELVGADGTARLAERGLLTPMAVRAHAYTYLNAHHDGFATEAQRAECFAHLASDFGLSARHWDALMQADAEENQILTRPGRAPSAQDIAAAYNFHALDTALRRAVKIMLMGLSLSPSVASDVRAAAAHLGVKAVVSGDGDTVMLALAEASAGTPRRAGSLARCALLLAHAHATRRTAGHVDAIIGARRVRLALTTDAFKALGANLTPTPDAGRLRCRLEMGELLHKDLLKARARGEAEGWRLRRLPDPLATAQGVLLPDFRLTRAGDTALLLLGPAPEGIWDAPLICLPTERKATDARAVLALIAAQTSNLFTLPAPTTIDVPSDVRKLCDRAAAQGMVRTADAQRALHLLNEEPLIDWLRQAQDPRVAYIPGVGLCAQELVSAIQQN